MVEMDTMDHFKLSTGIAAFVFVGLSWKLNELRKQRRLRHLPPGPKRSKLPYLGNVLDMPDSTNGAKSWLVFDQWAKQYGASIFISTVCFTLPMTRHASGYASRRGRNVFGGPRTDYDYSQLPRGRHGAAGPTLNQLLG